MHMVGVAAYDAVRMKWEPFGPERLVVGKAAPYIYRVVAEG